MSNTKDLPGTTNSGTANPGITNSSTTNSGTAKRSAVNLGTTNPSSTNIGRSASDPPASRPAKLRILDKEVQIGCKPGEEDDLLEAAAFVDQSMRDLRKRNTTSSIEKIAIVTAINTAHSLLKTHTQDTIDTSVLDRITAMNEKLDKILANTNTDDANATAGTKVDN